VTLAPAETEQARREGLLDTLKPARLPNLAQIPATNYEMWGNQAVQVHTAALGVLYNKEAIPNPPKDWRTLFDNIAAGKYGKRVSMPAGTYTWGPDFIWFVGHTYGGDADTAFAKLKGMMPNVVKFWTNPAEAINLFGTKQVDILLFWDGRSYDFTDKGNNWAAYYNPAPKSLGTSVSFAKVKNGSESAWDFINCALSAKAQLAHAKTLGYGITNTTVVYPEELKRRITPASDMVFPSYAKLIDSAPQWIERWNREMR
jgi:putative spermidine/putrescine transport system substrate-binding protein